ncbi:DNA adenine methylase [Candidatus Darwinibacter acetoxidans]
MRYMGGKFSMARRIADLLPDAPVVWEPFMGGGNVTIHLAKKYPKVIASDLHEDLMLMWQAVKDGWVPPSQVSREEYRKLRHAEPSALRGFVGFGCSFGGMWFNGYMGVSSKHSPAASARSVMRFQPHMGNVEFSRRSYDEISPAPGDVVYCDPPFEGVTKYSTGEFDHGKFWEWAKDLSEQGVRVFVSEYTAPAGWTSVLEVDRPVSSAGGVAQVGRRQLDKVFKYQPEGNYKDD